MNNEILYYAVYEEHTLGFLYRDELDQYNLAILHASILRGSTYNWLGGPILVDMQRIRKATAKDFEDYRVSLPSDF